MFGSFIVELMVGLLATFALLGLCVTTLTEVFQTYIKSIRAKNLQLCLKQLFMPSVGASTGTDSFYRLLVDHPLIQSMSPPGKQPSYLPSTLIADAVIALLLRADGAARDKQQVNELLAYIEQQVERVEPEALRSLLRFYLTKAQIQAENSVQLLTQFKLEIAQWIDAGMERAEGWSKRYAKALSLIISVVLCASLNINAIEVARALTIDPELRRTLFDQAQKYDAQLPSEWAKTCEQNKLPAQCRFEEARDSLVTSLNIGWEYPPAFLNLPLSLKAFGMLLYWMTGVGVSALAASMGGDYWYKLLSSVIRLTGPPPAKSGPAKD